MAGSARAPAVPRLPGGSPRPGSLRREGATRGPFSYTFAAMNGPGGLSGTRAPRGLLARLFPDATRTVLVVVAVVSVLALLLPEQDLLDWLAKDNDAIRDGQVWRLLTAGLVHGSFLHLAMNGMVLNDVGRLVESLFGGRRFLVLLWTSVLGGSLVSFVHNPHPSVGISGGLFGLVGAMLALGLRHRRNLTPPVKRILLRAPLEVIVLNLALGLALPIIDNSAHLGGLVTGFALALVLPPRPEVRAALEGRPIPRFR